MKFEAEGQEFAKFFRLLEQFIQPLKGQTNFSNRMLFLTCFERFLWSNIIRTIRSQIGKNIGILKPAGKVRKTLEQKFLHHSVVYRSSINSSILGQFSCFSGQNSNHIIVRIFLAGIFFLYWLENSSSMWAEFWSVQNLNTISQHSCSFCHEKLAENCGRFGYKNLLFHKEKHSRKWSSGVPYCSLLKPMPKASF